jgi:hypothetical protein
LSDRRQTLISELRKRQKAGNGEDVLSGIAADEIVMLRDQLQEMVDMVAPTLKSEHRLSQGLSSALIRSRQTLAR